LKKKLEFGKEAVMLPFDPRPLALQLLLVGVCISITILGDWSIGQLKKKHRVSPRRSRPVGPLGLPARASDFNGRDQSQRAQQV
jgi:hypothetical protein